MTLFNLLLSLYPIFPIAIVTRTRTAKSDLKRNPLFNLLGQNLEARVATVSITTRAWWLAPRPLPPPRRVPPHPARYRSRALSPRTTPNQITRAEQAAGGLPAHYAPTALPSPTQSTLYWRNSILILLPLLTAAQ